MASQLTLMEAESKFSLNSTFHGRSVIGILDFRALSSATCLVPTYSATINCSRLKAWCSTVQSYIMLSLSSIYLQSCDTSVCLSPVTGQLGYSLEVLRRCIIYTATTQYYRLTIQNMYMHVQSEHYTLSAETDSLTVYSVNT